MLHAKKKYFNVGDSVETEDYREVVMEDSSLPTKTVEQVKEIKPLVEAVEKVNDSKILTTIQEEENIRTESESETESDVRNESADMNNPQTDLSSPLPENDNNSKYI
jgi:hypothetical protein